MSDTQKESNLVRHAREELERAGLFDADSDYGGLLGKAVLEMIERFADKNHSGASAAMAVGLFKRLALFEPITPLTGEDDEWEEVDREDGVPTFQNRRCPRVFKKNGQAYDIEGRVFQAADGLCYINGQSRVGVSFPYTPTTEFVGVPASN